MRAVAYSEVLKGVADELGWKYDESAALSLDSQEWHAAKRAISKAYQKIHVASFWRELTLTEKRRFADDWNSLATYTAGDFVWYDPARAYYQALQDNVGEVPATLDVNGVATTSLEFWADALRTIDRSYWDVALDYVQGDIVYYVDEGLHYQAHALTVPAGTLPTDIAFWGNITEQDAFVPYHQTGHFIIDQVSGVYVRDPREHRAEPRVAYAESEQGIQVLCPLLNEVWLVYMYRPWKFNGDIYDPTLTYTMDEEFIVSTPDVPVISTPGATEFDTVALMLASNTALWIEAFCRNYTGLDGIKTQWFKTTDPNTLPNGTDILQSDDGAVVVRTFLRENTGTEITIPSASGTPYVVTVPVSYPTLADMRNGTEATQMVGLMSDGNGDAGVFALGGTGTDDGVNEIINAVGIHYSRVIFT